MSDTKDNQPLLQVRDLKTWFYTGERPVRAVDGINFDIHGGETFALVGESGSGKSMTSLSIMRLVPEPAGRIVAGSVQLHGQDILRIPETQMRDVRGRRIAMIFQEPMTSLNPVLTIGQQIEETVVRHNTVKPGSKARERAVELLDAVGIPDPRRRYSEYPHQLSGGMKQRVMIAIALAGEPELLIADEPTTALDVTIQSQVLDLLLELQQKTHMSILLITHDLGIVAKMADRVAVMYAGQIVEQADRGTFFSDPKHPYSQKLFDSLPSMTKRGQQLEVIHGSVPSLSTEFKGCRFEPRCDKSWQLCCDVVPPWYGADAMNGVLCHLYAEDQSERPPTKHPKAEAPAEPASATPTTAEAGGSLLSVKDLKVHFPIQQGLFKRVVGQVRAVDGVSMEIAAGQTLALVGESGCGKTTVGKGILQLLTPTDGTVLLNGENLAQLSKDVLRQRRGDMQIIFQDPFSSMNPRMMISDIIEEGMIAQKVGGDKAQRQQRIDELLDQVGLSPEMKLRYPHEFSGGQRQRICIARALAVEPKLIICDEPTSALDVSVQAQILNLLKSLQDRLGLAYLFITHNLSVVEYLAHEVAVMYLGRIVERGSVEEVIQNPLHPYTRALLSAVPTIEPESGREVIHLEGELPSPSNPPVGCHFHPRCPEAMEVCNDAYPDIQQQSATHCTSCYLYEEAYKKPGAN
jgi:peptide/nickel transport system ATP-binding protein